MPKYSLKHAIFIVASLLILAGCNEVAMKLDVCSSTTWIFGLALLAFGCLALGFLGDWSDKR